MGPLQKPSPAEHGYRHHEERPREHPQRGRDGEPGPRRAEEAEHAWDHSSPGEGKHPAQECDQRLFKAQELQHAAPSYSMQQLIWVTSRVNAWATRLIPSLMVGKTCTVSMMSSMVRPNFTILDVRPATQSEELAHRSSTVVVSALGIAPP